MTRKHLLLIVLTVGCAHPGVPAAGLGVTAAPHSAPATVIRLETAMPEIDIGATSTVTVTIENVRNLYTAEVKLAFDARHLSVIDAEPASDGVQARPLAELLKPEWVVKNLVDNDVGTVWYVVSHLRPTQPVTGTGGVLAIDFMGIAPGGSTITIEDFTLIARDRQHIEAEAQPVDVVVGPDGVLPPSPTPSDLGTPHTPPPPSTPSPTPTTGPLASPSPTPTWAPPKATATRPPTRTPPPTSTTPIEPTPTVLPTQPTAMPTDVPITPTDAPFEPNPIYLPFSYKYRH